MCVLAYASAHMQLFTNLWPELWEILALLKENTSLTKASACLAKEYSTLHSFCTCCVSDTDVNRACGCVFACIQANVCLFLCDRLCLYTR